MKILRPSVILGGLGVLSGSYFLWVGTFQLLSFDGNRKYIFPFLEVLLITMLGGLPIYFGIKLIRKPTASNIKWVAGILAVACCIWIGGYFEQYFSGIPKEWAAIVVIFVGTLIAIPLYILVAAFVFRSEKIELQKRRHLIGKKTTFIVAWQIWQLLYCRAS